jgi:hypothetical protein
VAGRLFDSAPDETVCVLYDMYAICVHMLCVYYIGYVCYVCAYVCAHAAPDEKVCVLCAMYAIYVSRIAYTTYIAVWRHIYNCYIAV